MKRYFILPLLGWLLITSASFGQYYGRSQGRMDPQEATAIAEYWINSYFRRAAHPREVQDWANELMSSRTPAEALAGLLSSREYHNYAGGTQVGFIRQLIEDVGHHEASRYEVEDVLRATAGASPQRIAYDFLRRYPNNWWPGPTATPPRELRYLYDRYGYGYGGRRY
jgi:hypothetical protein